MLTDNICDKKRLIKGKKNIYLYGLGVEHDKRKRKKNGRLKK